MRQGLGCIAVLALAVTLGACVEDRSRPFEPTSSGGGGGGGGAPGAGSASVRIVSPAAGDTLLKEAFTEDPGQEVVVQGEFPLGHAIAFEGYANRYGPIPFHSEVYSVEETGLVRLTRTFRAEVRHLEDSDQALLLAEIEDAGGSAISGDSIRVELR